MEKKFATLCCLLTIIIVGSCVFVTSKTIDFASLLHAMQIVIPAAIIAYICGLFMGKTLSCAKVDTEVLNMDVQQQFVDDLLLSPDEVLNINTSAVEQTENNGQEEAMSEQTVQDTSLGNKE